MRWAEKKRQLREAGCRKIDEGGNHEIWYSPITKQKFPVPRHDTQEIGKGMEKVVNKQAGLK